MADLDPIHPGRILEEEFLTRGQTAPQLAEQLEVDVAEVWAVIRGERPITHDLAIKLGKHFGMSSQFWLNLQHHYQEERRHDSHQVRFERAVRRAGLPHPGAIGSATLSYNPLDPHQRPTVEMSLDTFEDIIDGMVGKHG